jgi:hypothetical protein
MFANLRLLPPADAAETEHPVAGSLPAVNLALITSGPELYRVLND